MDESILLKAGSWSAQFQNGFIRYVRHSGKEFLRMIYFAVRDANWQTVPHTISLLSVTQDESRWSVKYHCACASGAIDFRWQCEINGSPEGLDFEIHGLSHSHFERNRIGFCVLHPIEECAGEPVQVYHSNGHVSEGFFPDLINPHQPFTDISGLQYKVLGSKIHLNFEGEKFEMEDQRNWSDASFKTYCTPLSLPFPVTVHPNDRVAQKIQMSIKVDPTKTMVNPDEYQLHVLEAKHPFPKIGLEANVESLDNWAIDKLKALNLSFLRVELRLDRDDHQGFDRKMYQAQQLEISIELVIFIDINRKNWLSQLTKVQWQSLNVLHVLVIDVKGKSVDSHFLEVTVPALRTIFGHTVPIGGGTNYYFTELNRHRPDTHLIDFVSFSSNPQVHAFDDQSIKETASVFGDMVSTAMSFSNNKPVHVSPITLKPRNNPDATQKGNHSNDDVPDKRQSSTLNAIWTLCSLKYLTESGASHVTLFQTVGEEGIMSIHKGETFPVFEVLALPGSDPLVKMIQCKSSHPLDFEGFVLESDKGRRLCVIANWRDEPIEVMVFYTQLTLTPNEIKFMPLN